MNWKAYEEVHFSANNIQRWVREGDEYVNRMTLEQMGKFETKVRQQADRIAELEKFNKAILKKGGYPYEKLNPIAWMSPDGKVSTTEGILFHIPLYTAPQTKPLSDEEIIKIRVATKPKSTVNWADTLAFAKAIEKRHGIK